MLIWSEICLPYCKETPRKYPAQQLLKITKLVVIIIKIKNISRSVTLLRCSHAIYVFSLKGTEELQQLKMISQVECACLVLYSSVSKGTITRFSSPQRWGWKVENRKHFRAKSLLGLWCTGGMSNDTISMRSQEWASCRSLRRLCEYAPEKHFHRKKTLIKSFISLQELHNQTSHTYLKVLWVRTCIFRQFLSAFLLKFCLNTERIYTFYYMCCAPLTRNRAAQPKSHSHKRFNRQQYIPKRERDCIAVALLSWMNSY